MNKLISKKIFTVVILFILTITISTNFYVLATDNSTSFKFAKNEYVFKGEETAFIEMTLPTGYTLKDVNFQSQDSNIADIKICSFDNYYKVAILSKALGETTITASIKDTNYSTTCKVRVDNPISFDVQKNSSSVGATLKISSSNSMMWSEDTFQAFEIQVTPINATEEGEWIRLGEQSRFAESLNKDYTYQITENCIVKARQISWWKNYGEKNLNVITENTIIIDDLEPTASIGAGIKIISESGSMNMKVGDTLKLSAELIELPTEDISKVVWKSYNTSIATVDNNGEVSAFSDGTFRIEASLENYRDVCVITAGSNEMLASNSELAKTFGAVNAYIPSTLSIDSTDFVHVFNDSVNITFSSSDEKIASIDENGCIKPVSAGKVTITANILSSNHNYGVSQEVEIKSNSKGNNSNNEEPKQPSTSASQNVGTAQVDNTVAQGKLPYTGLQLLSALVIVALMVCLGVFKLSKNAEKHDDDIF